MKPLSPRAPLPQLKPLLSEPRGGRLPRVVLAFLVLGGFALGAPPAGQPTNVTLVVTPALINQLAEGVRTNHPALRAAEARVDAARAEVDAVRTWRDPRIQIGGMFADREMRAEDGDLIYGVEQELPLFGRPRLEREVAAARLSRDRVDAEWRFQQLRRDLAQGLFRAALARQTVAIQEEDIRWLEQMVQTTDARYRAGSSTLVELLRLQNDLRRQRETVETSRQLLGQQHVALNRILNRRLDSPWESLVLPAPAGRVVFSPELVELAQRYEPRLRVLREEIREADAASQLTRRQRLPEIMVGAQGRNYTGNGDFRQAEVMVGFSFPWGNAARYRRDYDRDRARRTAAEQEAADYGLGIAEEVHGLVVRADAARREAVAYRDEIIPRARHALESAQAAWVADRAGFLDVMEARRMWLEARQMEARAVSEQYEMLSDLVLCCGLGDLEALQMIGVSLSTPAPAPTANHSPRS